MSQHHRRIRWTTYAPGLRKVIEARGFPQPCVDCQQAVTRDHSWQVGHVPGYDARTLDRPPRPSEVGPSHVRSASWPRNCNQIAGGRAGARMTNATRRARKDIREW